MLDTHRLPIAPVRARPASLATALIAVGALLGCSPAEQSAAPQGDATPASSAPSAPESQTPPTAEADAPAEAELEPAAAPPAAAEPSTIPLLLSVHLEARTARRCDTPPVGCASDDDFDANMDGLEAFLTSLDDSGLSATFQLHIQWLMRLDESERGAQLMAGIIDGGHEVALHHHHFDHADWDGYSDDPAAWSSAHFKYKNLDPSPMSDYMAALGAWEQRWDVRVQTMATPAFETDWQPAWGFRTTDDENTANATALDDPSGACQKSSGGVQTDGVLTLPNGPTTWEHEDLGLVVLGVTHTRFIGGHEACQRLLGDHVLEAAALLDPTSMDPSEVINLVFHLHNYSESAGVKSAFDDFFASAGAMPGLEPMTVQGYMCARRGACPQ